MLSRAVIATLTLNLSLLSALAASVAWDRSDSANVAGYKVYYGAASGLYTSSASVGNVTSASLPALSPGATCFVAVTSIDTLGLESDFSEVSYTAPATATPPAIVLSSPANNASYSAPAVIGLSVSVTANGHTLNKVQFLNGSSVLGERTAAPYSFTWTNVAAGTYALSARLVYDTTNTLSSASVAVNVTGLPSPWKTADVGPVSLAGSVTASSGVFNIKGSGQISGNSDSFRFVYQTLSGDGEIRAQVRSVQNSGTAGDTGVMIRESLTAGSRYVMVGLTGSGVFQWQNRRYNAYSTSTSSSVTGVTPNTWVRLVRTGSTLTSYRSADGTNWTRLGAVTISMASNIYFGMAVASGQTSTINTSSMANVIAVP